MSAESFLSLLFNVAFLLEVRDELFEKSQENLGILFRIFGKLFLWYKISENLKTTPSVASKLRKWTVSNIWCKCSFDAKWTVNLENEHLVSPV